MNKEFLPFEEARDIVRKTKIKTQMQWKYQRKYLPSFIPRDPHKIYKGKWKGFADWLGTNNIRGNLRKYKVNDDYFKKWSHDMAYILGFWWADGFMRERMYKGGKNPSYFIGICQQTKDIYILEEILRIMKSESPICIPKSRPNMSHFEINSKTIFDDIVRLGGFPKKSLKIRFPNIPAKYFSDFIRGLFDGDGSISICKTTPYSYICSGNLLFIKDLKRELDRIGICGKITNNGNKLSICYLLRFRVNETKKLGNFMYNNSTDILKLKRKYDKFIEGGMYGK